MIPSKDSIDRLIKAGDAMVSYSPSGTEVWLIRLREWEEAKAEVRSGSLRDVYPIV